jgi:hypothetical protein
MQASRIAQHLKYTDRLVPNDSANLQRSQLVGQQAVSDVALGQDLVGFALAKAEGGVETGGLLVELLMRLGEQGGAALDRTGAGGEVEEEARAGQGERVKGLHGRRIGVE